MSGQKIIQGLKEALDYAYGEQPDWCPPAVWAQAKGWVEAHLSMQATGAASASLPVAIVAKAILAAKAEERQECLAAIRALHADAWGVTEEQSALEEAIAALERRGAAIDAIRKRGEANVSTARKSENQEA
jgi:hypothetical protein